jgi:hypothetical protein
VERALRRLPVVTVTDRVTVTHGHGPRAQKLFARNLLITFLGDCLEAQGRVNYQGGARGHLRASPYMNQSTEGLLTICLPNRS